MWKVLQLGWVWMVLASVVGAQLGSEPPVPPGLEKAMEYYAKTGQAQQQVVDGVLMMPYGVGRPEIVCAPYQVCTVSLEPGEMARSFHIGNEPTWTVWIEGVGAEGSGDYVQSLVLKPLLCDLETSLVVFTDRRQYHLALRSLPCGSALERTEVPNTAWVPRTAFWYPQQALTDWAVAEVVEASATREAAASEAPEPGLLCSRFRYQRRAKRRFPWEPTVICDDTEHTYIGIPDGVAETGVLFGKGTGGYVLVNYVDLNVDSRRFLKTEHLVESGRLLMGRPRGKDAVLDFKKVGEE